MPPCDVYICDLRWSMQCLSTHRGKPHHSLFFFSFTHRANTGLIARPILKLLVSFSTGQTPQNPFPNYVLYSPIVHSESGANSHALMTNEYEWKILEGEGEGKGEERKKEKRKKGRKEKKEKKREKMQIVVRKGASVKEVKSVFIRKVLR